MSVSIEIVRCKKSLKIDRDLTEWLMSNDMVGRDTINLTGSAQALLEHLEKAGNPAYDNIIALVKDFVESNSKAKYGSYELVLRLK